MDKIKSTLRNMRIAFGSKGITFLYKRIPSILFWSVVSTGAIIGAQFLYFNMLPAEHFARYDSPAKVADVELGEKPIIDYCRYARDDYAVTVYAQIRKVEPPVFTERYEVNSTIPAGHDCAQREVGASPKVPGEYQIFYTAEVTLPFGIKKYVDWETEKFNVTLPQNLYSNYQLTVTERDSMADGKPVYQPGSDLSYKFTATLLVTTFGTLERHIVCENKDFLVDVQSGRTIAGEKDSVDRTLKIPDEARGTCHLEKRYVVTVEGDSSTVTQTLRSNDFTVQ